MATVAEQPLTDLLSMSPARKVALVNDYGWRLLGWAWLVGAM